MTLLRTVLLACSLVSLSTSAAWPMTWNDSDRKEEAENAYKAYRLIVKDRTFNQLLAELDTDNFNIAFNNWKTAYEIAPAAEINTGLKKKPRKNDPCQLATQLQEEGRFSEAVAQYEQCLESAEDDAAKAQVLYNIAFIQTWELGQLGAARSNANKAASLLSGWGKPYILIGDIYIKMSRECYDSWDKSLAVLAALDKYEYARSIDPEVADEAGKRISNFSGALPNKEEGFIRKVLAGQPVMVGCGIREMVKVRFQ